MSIPCVMEAGSLARLHVILQGRDIKRGRQQHCDRELGVPASGSYGGHLKGCIVSHKF